MSSMGEFWSSSHTAGGNGSYLAGLFESYLEDSEGIYSGAVDFDALTMEPADPSLRDSSN